MSKKNVVREIDMLPNEQREALSALANAHGGHITPQIVVDAARDPESPLHSAFQWDDAVAGEAYRLAQARALFRLRTDGDAALATLAAACARAVRALQDARDLADVIGMNEEVEELRSRVLALRERVRAEWLR